MSNEAVLHDNHSHEHAHHDTFITKYVFSQDHKMIAKQFLITGMIWAVLGGFMSVLFRLQLGYPDSSFPWMEDLLGKWAKGGHITPEAYYALVTTHGTVLVFFVLTAGLSGTFANFLIPLQIGARDMASPFMNMLSQFSVYEFSDVRNTILKIDALNNPKIETWKNSVMAAMKAGNEEKYYDLISIYKKTYNYQ